MDINWTTVLTIAGAFGAASTAQIVSHLLTQSRDEKKYKKECLQKLYSPLIFKINDYLNAENLNAINNSETNNLDTNKLFKEITDKISDNLMYATTDLILAYEDLKSISTYGLDEDENKDFIMLQRMEICSVFISQYMDISKDLKTLSESVNEKLNAAYFFTQFYLLITDCIPFYETDIEPKIIFNYFHFIELVIQPQNDLLERIRKVREDLSQVTKTTAHKDKLLIEETYSDAFNLLYEIFDKFSHEDASDFWRNILYKHTDSLKKGE